MIYNNTDIDTAEGITEYEEPPTWKETLSASVKNFTAVSLSTSEFNYRNDERQDQMKIWKDTDPENTWVYDQVGTLSHSTSDKLEALYEEGKIDTIKNGWGGREYTDSSIAGSFLRFKELQKQYGFSGPKDVTEIAKNKSIQDYYESGDVLSKSEYTSAKLLGTMGGALQDPVTLATLPLGTWKTGASIIGTAVRAFGEEALIETAAQAIIAPTAYAYKQELAIKTSIKEEAYNAVASIATAGLVRGVGSATFDLSAKGIKALKAKDPELGKEYEAMNNSSASENISSHIDDLHKAEFSNEPITEITSPDARGMEINKAEAMPEFDDLEKHIVQVAEEEDLMIVTGQDIEGNVQTTSYGKLVQEYDDNDIMYKKIEDCLLGVG